MFAISREHGNHSAQHDTLCRMQGIVALSDRCVGSLGRDHTVGPLGCHPCRRKRDASARKVVASLAAGCGGTKAPKAQALRTVELFMHVRSAGASPSHAWMCEHGGKLPPRSNAMSRAAQAGAICSFLIQPCFVGSQCEYDAGNMETRSNQIRDEKTGRANSRLILPSNSPPTLKHGTLRGRELPCLAGFNGASITSLTTSCCRRLQSA
jgi:hypothetical protein